MGSSYESNLTNDGGSGGGSIINLSENIIGGNETVSDIITIDGTILINNYRQGYPTGSYLLNYNEVYGSGGGGANSHGYPINNNLVLNGGEGKYSDQNINFKDNFNLPIDNSVGEYVNNNIYFGGGGSGSTFSNLETLGGLGGGGTYSNNLDKLDGLSNSGGGGAGTLYKTRSGNGGSGIVIIKLKESSQSFNFNVTYNNNEILNQNYITTSEFKDVFNITSHLDYLTINETFVEHFAYGANYSIFENGNLDPAVNPGIYDNENSQYWGRQTIYETNVKGRFLWNKPEGVEEVIAYVWGAGGGAGPGYTGGFHSERHNIRGGNGGFVKAKINVKDIDKLNIIIGQCGGIGISNKGWPGGGKSGGSCGCGGGLSGIFLEDEFKIDNYGWSHGHDYYLTFQKINSDIPDSSILIIAGGGGGGGGYSSSDNYQSTLDGNWFKAIGGDAGFETENYIYGKSGFNTKLRLSNSGGPGTLISGGSGGGGGWASGQSGSKFKGGDTGRYNHNGYLADNSGTGGSGYYGGGSAGYNGIACAGGGGSSYYAHNLVSPIIAFGNDTDSLNTTNYVPYNIPKSTSLGGTYFSNENNLDHNGGNGYIILEYSYKNQVDRNLYIKYYPTKYITVQTIDEFIPEINLINLRNEESNYKFSRPSRIQK